MSAPTILHMMSEASHLLEAHLASQGTGGQHRVTGPPPTAPHASITPRALPGKLLQRPNENGNKTAQREGLARTSAYSDTFPEAGAGTCTHTHTHTCTRTHAHTCTRTRPHSDDTLGLTQCHDDDSGLHLRAPRQLPSDN